MERNLIKWFKWMYNMNCSTTSDQYSDDTCKIYHPWKWFTRLSFIHVRVWEDLHSRRATPRFYLRILKFRLKALLLPRPPPWRIHLLGWRRFVTRWSSGEVLVSFYLHSTRRFFYTLSLVTRRLSMRGFLMPHEAVSVRGPRFMYPFFREGDSYFSC